MRYFKDFDAELRLYLLHVGSTGEGNPSKRLGFH
jgi:hypothetical protein